MKIPALQFDKTLTRDAQKKTVGILLGLILVLAGMYGYFLCKSVVNVIVREEVEQKIATTNARLSELELTYINAKDEIDMQLARSMGFEKVEKRQYVARSQDSERFTLRGAGQ